MLIPDRLVQRAAAADSDAATRIAERLIPAVRELVGTSTRGVSVRRTSAGDVVSFRIDIADCPYYATITEHDVVERYSVSRTRTGRRMDVRPVLVELMHIFTICDEEGALVSASDAIPPARENRSPVPSVFADLFAAASTATGDED